MSQSPESLADTAERARYGESWKDVITLVRSGASWSGRERNNAYLNVGLNDDGSTRRFANVSAVTGFDFADDGRALAIVDWDRDGDLDVWVRNRTAPRLRLLRNDVNQLANRPGFITVKLVGATTNRNAIGAVATLTSPSRPPITQSVRAGDGFLSQSSRWLHFGGCEPDGTNELSVRWPDGTSQRFSNIESGGRYVIRQDNPQPVKTASRSVQLADSPQIELPSNSTAARIVLPARMPLPKIDWRDESGSVSAPRVRNNLPTLLTFWTSTCPVCREEISTLDADQSLYDSRGLNVVAVNIDDLQTDSSIDSMVDLHVSNPVLAMRTTAASLQRIDNLQRALFDKFPPFAVPMSFLLDAESNIVVMYRGAVDANTLFEDVAVTRCTNVQLRDFAVPMNGSWFTKPATDSEFIEFAAKTLYVMNKEQGLRYFAAAVDKSEDAVRQNHLRAQLVATYRKLARAARENGQIDRSRRYLMAAVPRCQPQQLPRLHYDIALTYTETGDYASAEDQLRKALGLQPNFQPAQRQLERILQMK